MILLRKAGSLIIHIEHFIRNVFLRGFYLLFRQGIRFGSNTSFSKGVSIRATDGGRILIGSSVTIGRNAKIEAKSGTIIIGDNVFVGDGCLIVARQLVEIGGNSQIAEYVVVRDQDHRFDKRPIKDAGFNTSPVFIGSDVWIGCKSTILKNSKIGDGVVVAAHSLVRGDIQSHTLVAGVPAIVKRHLS